MDSRSRSQAPLPASPHFSADALAQLRDAVRDYGSRWDAEGEDQLRRALHGLCAEACEKGLGPERLLVAVKASWAQAPGLAHTDPLRVSEAFGRVLAWCLVAFYGPDARRGSLLVAD